MIQRERRKKERKVYAMFVDMKAAFDRVDRTILWRILEEKDIEESLIGRIKNI